MTSPALSTACPVHDDQEHGKEAEELRSGLERLMYTEYVKTKGHENAVLVTDLQALLDSVDARDSLAYLERKDGTDG